jgi:hypothetical protein
MKYMMIIKGPELTEPPPQGLIDAINTFGGEAKDAGVFVEWGGLESTSKGSRVSISKGRLVVTDGPFTETKEVIGGYAVYNVASKEEAMDWARRFMDLHVKHWPKWEGQLEVRGMMFEEQSA